MAITDLDQLHEIAWRTVDDITFLSGLWTVTEIAGYFNQRQNRFNRDSKLLLAHQPVACVNGTARYDLPQDWIASLRGTWTPAGATVDTTPVVKGDRLSAQYGIQSNNPPDRPILFDDQAAGPLLVELFPTPTTDGSFELLYACVLSTLNFDGSDDIFDLPDEFVPYVTYGVLADMLSKDGRGQDLARAAYCEQRFQEGIGLAQVLLAGFA